MIDRLFFLSATALAVLLPSNASADVNAPFSATRVSDRELSDVFGTGSSYATLTRGKVATVVDIHARNAFLDEGSISRLEMDNWWGSVGSELIANAVRNQP